MCMYMCACLMNELICSLVVAFCNRVSVPCTIFHVLRSCGCGWKTAACG